VSDVLARQQREQNIIPPLRGRLVAVQLAGAGATGSGLTPQAPLPLAPRSR
jgi:hypothetical protein